MTATDTRNTKQLFSEWRKGDAAAGGIMAQRFADWYYAIATSRLGEKLGARPCENACARFSQGVVQITDARALVQWAHEIIQDELKGAGDRVRDGDEPNAYTGKKSPKALLNAAKAALPAEVRLLEAVYGGKAPASEIDTLAEPLGGNPLGILRARYRVKAWLRDNKRVPFDVAPESPILDRAPLPLYESGRMATPAEEANFEQWMISDHDLCKDIAEFATFSIALRGGLPEMKAEPAKAEVRKSEAPAAESSGASAAGAAAAGGIAIVVVGGGLALVVVLLIVAYFVMGG